MNILKNIELDKIIELSKLLDYRKGEIVSRTLIQNEKVSITLFSFFKGEEISSHQSSGDAFVYCLDGEGELTIGENKRIIHKGECIVMPNHISHALYAKESFKMMLIVCF